MRLKAEKKGNLANLFCKITFKQHKTNTVQYIKIYRNQVSKVHQTKSGGVPDLVAKMSITHHTIDVQVYIASLKSIGQQTKA